MNKRRRNVKRVIAVLMALFVVATTAYYGNIGPALAEAPGAASEEQAAAGSADEEVDEISGQSDDGQPEDPQTDESEEEDQQTPDGSSDSTDESGDNSSDVPDQTTEENGEETSDDQNAEENGSTEETTEGETEDVTPAPEEIPELTVTPAPELTERTLEPQNAQELAALEDHVSISVSGQLPEGATVQTAASSVAKGVNAEGSPLYTLDAFDIKVYNADGTEFQPAAEAPLTVTISSDSIIKAINAGVNDFAVYHYANGTDAEPEKAEIVSYGANYGIEFKAAGFSVYEVTRVQHTATYNFYCSEEASGNAVNTQALTEDGVLTEPDLSAYMEADSGAAAMTTDADAAGTADGTTTEVPQYVDMVPVGETEAEAAGTDVGRTTAQKVFKGWYYMDENGNATDQEFSADNFDQTAGTISGTDGILTANQTVNVMGVFVSEETAVETTADATITVEQGSSGTISNVTNYNSWRVVDSNGNQVSGVTATQESSGDWSNQTYSLTVSASESATVGTYKIQYGTRRGPSTTWQDSGYTVEVTAAKGTYTVYVYVAAKDLAGNAMSAECLELLGIDSSTIDGNGYFPAGQIEISKSLINSKSGYNTGGEPLIMTNSDWSEVLAALGKLDTSTLIDEGGVSYTLNKGNKVGNYISQAAGDLGYSWGQQRTALFRWNGSEDYGFVNINTYHLDLRFTTNKITFYFGNNGLDNDGQLVDTRVYITGSTIQTPKDFSSQIPAHYNWDGKYYSDEACTQEWNGIGTSLDSDQTVYIKLVPEGQMFINYEVAIGEGTVSPTQETVYESAETAVGSTPTAGEGYVFEGWYVDKDCNTKVPDNWVDGTTGKIQPMKPTDGWVNGTTYYAKFVPENVTLTLNKIVEGNMANLNDSFAFTVTSDKPMGSITGKDDDDSLSENKLTANANIKGHTRSGDVYETVTITVPKGATVTITETNASDYTTSYESTDTSGTLNGGVYTINNLSEDTSVTVTNSKEVIIDTGIWSDKAPYAAMLGIIALAGTGYYMMILRRRRSH